MVHYSIDTAKQNTLEFCKYPVPRTASDIIRYLKANVRNFYQKTREDRVVPEWKEKIANELVRNGQLVEYSLEDKEFTYARKLLSLYFQNQNRESPRKIQKLYQINFLLLGDTSPFGKLPVAKSINVEMCALGYRFVKEKNVQNFLWKIINLLWCYSIPGYRSKINIEIENISFEEKEKEQLLRLLDRSTDLNSIYSTLPFTPNLQKALDFLLEM